MTACLQPPPAREPSPVERAPGRHEAQALPRPLQRPQWLLAESRPYEGQPARVPATRSRHSCEAIARGRAPRSGARHAKQHSEALCAGAFAITARERDPFIPIRTSKRSGGLLRLGSGGTRVAVTLGRCLLERVAGANGRWDQRRAHEDQGERREAYGDDEGVVAEPVVRRPPARRGSWRGWPRPM